MTRIVVAGAAGRMGRMLVEAVARDPEATLVGALERSGNPQLGADVGELAGLGRLGVPVVDRLDDIGEPFDVLVDFTQPDAKPRSEAALDELFQWIVANGGGSGRKRRLPSCH